MGVWWGASDGMGTGDAIRAIFGLLVVFALAYVLGHPVVRRYEKKFGLSQLFAFGLPFLILGLVFRSEGVLSDPVLDAIEPLLVLGLGWIGFALGFRFDIRIFDRFPGQLLEAFALTALLPFAVMLGSISVILAIGEGVDASAAFFRDALVLATAGAMTSRAVLSRLTDDHVSVGLTARERLARIIHLEELAGFAGLLVLGAFFRADGVDSGWSLPPFGWIFVTIGGATMLGVLVYASLTTVHGLGETIAVMLGAIALSAGVAGFLKLSPLIVCFVAGLLLANLPGAWKDEVKQALWRLERPLYLIFLVIVGASWRLDQWEGWVIMALFVVARAGSRFLGVRLLAARHPDLLTEHEERHLASSPMGGLAIAIVVGAQELFSGPTTAWIVHAVVFGSIVSELLPQFLKSVRPVVAVPAAILGRIAPDRRAHDTSDADDEHALASEPAPEPSSALASEPAPEPSSAPETTPTPAPSAEPSGPSSGDPTDPAAALRDRPVVGAPDAEDRS